MGHERHLPLPKLNEELPVRERERALDDGGIVQEIQDAVGRREVAFLSALLVAFLLHALYLSVVAEDAFITFRFARNLARGHGIVWNPGEAPVEGTTSFLWLVLCALALRAGLDVVLVAQCLGIVASLATIALTHRFARRILDLSPGPALVPCLLLAASGPFAAWATSGMEINLFAGLVLLACLQFGAWVRFDSRRHLELCFASLLLASLTRPEGFLVFALLAGLGLAIALDPKKPRRRAYGRALAVYALPFLAYFIWRAQHFGYLLPNPYYAKTGGGLHQALRGTQYGALFALHFLLPLAPLWIVAAWERGAAAARPPASLESLRRQLRGHVGTALCALLPVAYAAYVVSVGGDYMAMYRFFVPVLPQVYLLAGLATQRLERIASSAPRRRTVLGGLVAAATALTAFQSTPWEQRVFAKPPFMHGTHRGIQIERWHVARLALIGNFFRGYRQSAEESLALHPVGAISYYSDMTIHSFLGIVDPQIAHQQPRGRVLGAGFPGHEKEDIPRVLARRPSFVMFSRLLTRKPQSYPDLPEPIAAFLRQHYGPRAVWLEDTANGQEGYFTFLERKDRDSAT